MAKFYKDIFSRNSADNAGMTLMSSIHYGVKYNNITCLRDMTNPAAAHCLSPQPMHFSQYHGGMNPHISSGIPNFAFYTVAKAVGGKSWLKVGQIGGPHLKSWGIVDFSSLSQVDRVAVEALFERSKRTPVPPEGPAHSDQFRYRLTRGTSTGSETVEALESELPQALKASVSAKIE